MSGTTSAQRAPDPSPRHVIERINRFSTLRAAERALKPSVRRRRELPSASVGRDLLVRLRHLLAHTRGKRTREENAPPAAAELARIDERLDLFSRQLRATADRSPMAQLRATLPSIAYEHPEEVAALLDLCLEGDASPATRLPLVDYLVTLLASDHGYTRKSLIRDPSEVSRQVAARCRRLANEPEEVGLEIAQTFDRAIREVAELDNLEEIVQRMRVYKAKLDGRIFIPSVLRSVVAYNLAVSNRIEALLDRERERARAAEAMFLALDALDALELQERGEDRCDAAPSALDSPALITLHEALCDVLSGYKLPEGPAAKLATSFDVAALDDHEVRAFTEPDASCELTGRLLRLTVTAGLARQALSNMSDALQELEVDASSLTDHWVPELTRRLDEAIEHLAATGQLALAEQLRASQQRHLAA